MAGTAAKVALLTIMVASVCLDVCMACGVCSGGGTPQIPKTPKAPKYPKPPKSPKGGPGGQAPPLPKLLPPPLPKTCPVDILKLGVCSPLLGGIVVGLLPPSNACCALLKLLGVDLELCLCLALDANVLGLISIHAKVDAVVSILTSCGYTVRPDFVCPPH